MSNYKFITKPLKYFLFEQIVEGVVYLKDLVLSHQTLKWGWPPGLNQSNCRNFVDCVNCSNCDRKYIFEINFYVFN